MGDDFFDYFEKISTRTPIIITHGNHEQANFGEFLGFRFWMNESSSPFWNNFFTFQVKNFLFFANNPDINMKLPQKA